MSKEVRVCACGAIHFFDNDILDEAITNDKVVLLICGSCGRGIIMGADRVPNYYAESEDDPDEAFDMYSYDAKRSEGQIILDADSFADNHGRKPIHKVVYDDGKRVIMESGYRANHYSHEAGFDDMLYPDFLYDLLTNPSLTMNDVRRMTGEYNRRRTTVNMRCLINSLSDEELDLLSKYHIKGLDFSGTKWDRKTDGEMIS